MIEFLSSESRLGLSTIVDHEQGQTSKVHLVSTGYRSAGGANYLTPDLAPKRRAALCECSGMLHKHVLWQPRGFPLRMAQTGHSAELGAHSAIVTSPFFGFGGEFPSTLSFV